MFLYNLIKNMGFHWFLVLVLGLVSVLVLALVSVTLLMCIEV